MKNLIKLLGISAFGALSLNSFNLNAQYKSFAKEDYEKYCMTYSLIDINGDSINDAVVVDYDLNMNGKKDVRALFLITGKREELEGVIYTTKNKACMLVTDNNEDGEDDEILADSDLDGKLDTYRNLKDIRKPKAVIL